MRLMELIPLMASADFCDAPKLQEYADETNPAGKTSTELYYSNVLARNLGCAAV